MPIFANSPSLLLPTQSRMLRRPSCSTCSPSQADLSTRDMDSGCSLTWHVTSLASGSSGFQSYSQVSTLQCPAGVGKDGVTMVSKELCYVAKGVNRLLLSINSGIISNDFPSAPVQTMSVLTVVPRLTRVTSAPVPREHQHYLPHHSCLT